MKTLIAFLLLFTAAFAGAQSTEILPTLARNNVWTGTNTFTPGNLIIGSNPQSCTSGQFMTGYSNTFVPICSTPTGNVVTTVNGDSGAIVFAAGTNMTLVQSPTGTFTFNCPNCITSVPANVTSLNGLQGVLTLTAGANITISQTSSTNLTIAGTGGGGGGSGTVSSGSPYQMPFWDLSSTTTIDANPTLYAINSNMTTSQINTLISGLNCGACQSPFGGVATIVVPDGVLPQAWTNTADNSTGSGNVGVELADLRSGARAESLSRWGVDCNARYVGVQLTNASTTVAPNNSTFSANDIGSTLVVTGTISGTPTRFMATVTAYNSGTGNITISTADPFSGSAVVYNGAIGYLNSSTMQNAMKGLAVGKLVGQIPAGCSILTDTFQYTGGQSLVGDAAGPAHIIGIPGRDILQNTDAAPITNVSLTSNVVTLTGSNNFIPGEQVQLKGLTTNTFLNNAFVTILSTGLSTTQYEVAFTHANVSSVADTGHAAPANLGGASGPGVQLRNVQFDLNYSIDATKPWNAIDPTGATTNMNALDREFGDKSPIANNPLAPGWAANATNGVASITQNSAVICVPTTLVNMPVVGQQIIFRDTPTVFQSTISSTAGSCSAGFNPFTMAAALPNTSGYTIAQTEWVSTTQVQALTVAMSAGAITYPLTITVGNSTAYIPGWESNVASHGWVKIGNEEYGYIGGPNALATAPYTIVLRTGPSSTAGWSIGTAVVPENPCSAARETPWPVTPTINSGDSTPSGAKYFAGGCVGNAAISMPQADARLDTGITGYSGTGYSEANVENIVINANTSGGVSGNTAGIYFGGNTAPYGSSFHNISIVGATHDIVEGPATAGNHGVAAVGPTGDGNHWFDLHLVGATNYVFTQHQNSTIDRVDAYTTAYNPFDSTAIGASTAFIMHYTSDEQTGNVVVGCAYDQTNNINSEPETGSHIEVPPYAIFNCSNSTYSAIDLEGIPSVFGGNNQVFTGGVIQTPSWNYGSNNVFKSQYGASSNNMTAGLQTSTIVNWGLETNASVQIGNSSTGPYLWGTNNVRSSSDGQNDQFAYFGNFTQPIVDSRGGMIYPDEFYTGTSLNPTPMSVGATYDSTALISGSYTACTFTGTSSCITTAFDGNNLIFIGPQNRIPADLTAMSLMVKSSTLTSVEVVVSAVSEGACSGGTLLDHTFTVTSAWTEVEVPVNFTGYSGCALRIKTESAIAGQVSFQYVDFLPIPARYLLKNATFTGGAACTIPGEILGSDVTNMYVCGPAQTVLLLPFGGGGGGGGGGGTVTSVAIASTPSWLTVSGSPITTSGTVTLASGTFSGNLALMTPNGSSGLLTPRALVPADIPALNYVTAGTGDATFSGAGSVAVTVGNINGGTAFKSQGVGPECNNGTAGQLNICTTINVAGPIISAVFTPASTSSIIFNAAAGNTQIVTLSANTTSTLSGAVAGQDLNFEIAQNGTGNWTFAWPSNFFGFPPVQLTAGALTTARGFFDGTNVYADGYNGQLCTSNASPAVCGTAYKGFSAVPAGTNSTLVINSTAVGPNSIIEAQGDQSISLSGITCSTDAASGAIDTPARSSGTSFTLRVPGTITGGSYCLNWVIINP